MKENVTPKITIYFILLTNLIFILYPVISLAKIKKGLPCSACHTMHYSQHGGILTHWGGSGPYKALVINDCLGCHTGNNDGTNYIPYVLSTSPPDYSNAGVSGNTLAGGNFYWVSQGQEDRGHNVKPFPPDSVYGYTPPGGSPLSSQLSCAGLNGCHGDRSKQGDFEAILGAHHANDDVIDGNTVGTSYRFLLGIKGYEDPKWEYKPNVFSHNQYKGADRISETEVDKSTISYFCAQCHGNFHSGSSQISADIGGWGSPWLRHPTDYDMGNTLSDSEYRNYPGDYPGAGATGSNPYSLIAPVGSEDVSSPKSNILFQKDAIITCISCHRAHGTPYKHNLRWDYYGWPETTSINGCNACHTAKN
ncbi:cytochrome c3 family protein [Thermodesulfatator autotrophicus]|uniref:Doubled CXXCH motif domain-containing protein n=1 Tax=Thermodesulfatator autotrophicus TaxID=1795632 RepID=A0A177E6Z3_9BACT|nr:cytochrome c3 family protein [Thermodesulfatator autotrophicus]OAG27714.1 hypothetical protein TH606_05405 [Thermodesulfatator autotrophicus]